MVSCSSCDPDVGTHKVKGVCEDLCNTWYESCRDGMYTSTKAYLAPCYHTSLVCFKLKEAVQSGREFCEQSGFTVVSSRSSSFPFTHLLSSHEIPHDTAPSTCFDGTSTRYTGGSSFRTKAASHHQEPEYTTRESMQDVQRQQLYVLLMRISLVILFCLGVYHLRDHLFLYKMCKKSGLSTAQEEKLRRFQLEEELEKLEDKYKENICDDSRSPLGSSEDTNIDSIDPSDLTPENSEDQ